jgi:uncharacterized protein YndB with AHSA1/START domain
MTIPMELPDGRGSVRATVDIAASPDAVFAALTDERQLAAWLGGDPAPPSDHGAALAMPSLAIPGQPWRAPAIAPDGSLGSVSGEFAHVDPPRRLVSTWRASWDDFAPDRVSFDLTPIRIGGASGTRLCVTHTRAMSHLHVTAMAVSTEHGDWSARLGRLTSWISAPPVIGHAIRVGPASGAAWYGDRYPGWVSALAPSGDDR